MKTLKVFSSALVASLLLAGSAHAQSHRASTVNGHEVRHGVTQRSDDRMDVVELERVLARFDAARARRNNASELASVDHRLRELLRAELAESRVETAQARAEARRERGESRAENRDDVRDARAEAASLAARRSVARELNSLMGVRSQVQLNRKRALIVELVQLGKQELRADRQELREDRKDRRNGWRS
ncbi:hypothetical protein HPC49_03560 [Pyxidicoccus fallax]|uniref:Uncharacterized protein n=1 Tax=Pyxidicoccus fallax TaxID=394095 RepID=A0A848LPJ6_9BACT|nr:hypothetical protein [Pyxidicoccus fallax]NMO19817.1 hypothetical protein [Pyxidicoccus fallax]NPC77334.1 hypothetical protein [Pyxidicoccus fallax]